MSPSQLRREKKGREASKVTQKDTEKVPVQVTYDNLHFKCTKFDSNFKYEKGFNIHIGKAHKKEELLTLTWKSFPSTLLQAGSTGKSQMIHWKKF